MLDQPDAACLPPSLLAGVSPWESVGGEAGLQADPQAFHYVKHSTAVRERTRQAGSTSLSIYPFLDNEAYLPACRLCVLAVS